MTTANKVQGKTESFFDEICQLRIVSLQVTMNLNDSLVTDC